MKTIFQCEDTTDGIFTAIYDAWASELGHEHVKLQIRGGENYELFSEYRTVETDHEKAAKVGRTLKKRFTGDDYTHLYQAVLSGDKSKADSIYRTVILGLSQKNRGNIMQHLQNPDICKVFELSRRAGNEAHHYLGFVRFRELCNGILYSEIRPDNQVLSLMGEHFADRFPREHFMIHDRTHGAFLVHEAGKAWILLEGAQIDEEFVNCLSTGEKEIQELWKSFCQAIAIRERRNLRLQKQLLPRKFREFLPEKF